MKSPGMYRSLRRPQSSPLLLQRKLTLNDFPMEYGVKDAQQRAVSSRLERFKLQDRVQSARKESGSLREYSRRRFQTVVDLETNAPPSPPPSIPSQQQQQQPPPPVPRLRPLTTDGGAWNHGGAHAAAPPPAYPPCPATPHTPTNGPTRDGSILYNGVPLLLSSIRTRPTSEPPGRFDHLRGTYAHYPYIQRLLEQSNCEYRLVSSPCHSARRLPSEPSQEDFAVFVPAGCDGDRDGDADGNSSNSGVRMGCRMTAEAWGVAAGDEDGPLLVSTARSRSPRSEELLQLEKNRGPASVRDRLTNPRERSHGPQAVPTLNLILNNGIGGGGGVGAGSGSSTARTLPSDLPGFDHAALSTHSTLSSGASPSRSALPKKPTSSTSKPAEPASPLSVPREQFGSGSRPSSARSQTSTVSSVSLTTTPWPHCWVDDVTVSSDESLADRDAAVNAELEGAGAGGGGGAGGAADRASLYSADGGDPAAKGLHPPGLAPGGAQASASRALSPSGEKKKISQTLKRVSSPVQKAAPAGKGKPAQQGCPRSIKLSSAGSKAGGGGGGVKSLTAEEAVAAAGKDPAGGVGGDAALDGEDEERELVLPRFVCPSSESKSRQAAIKEWLAKSSFSGACRTVPLM